jgi:catechol 2,3-dioxygenase
MEQQSTQLAPTSIDPGTHIGLVTLRVADLDRSLSFYEGILGFREVERTDGRVLLGAQEGPPLLELLEVPGAAPQPRWSTGLYHVAILLPTRADLGRLLIRMAKAGLEIGQGDHLVSEALYISDPDDNGLELYRDRPRDTWQWTNGTVRMASDPVDVQGLMEEGLRDAAPWDVLPAGTTVGHIHLQVADIPQAEQFYHGILGFDIIARMPSALFVSAGGYHHHIGMNTWQSRGAGPAPETGAGLGSFVIALPHREALAEVRKRLDAHGIPVEEQGDSLNLADPWRNRIRLAVEPGT